MCANHRPTEIKVTFTRDENIVLITAKHHHGHQQQQPLKCHTVLGGTIHIATFPNMQLMNSQTPHRMHVYK